MLVPPPATPPCRAHLPEKKGKKKIILLDDLYYFDYLYDLDWPILFDCLTFLESLTGLIRLIILGSKEELRKWEESGVTHNNSSQKFCLRCREPSSLYEEWHNLGQPLKYSLILLLYINSQLYNIYFHSICMFVKKKHSMFLVFMCVYIQSHVT